AMEDPRVNFEPSGSKSKGAFVSTGHLPSSRRIQALVSEACERFVVNDEGAHSDVYPALARVPRGLLGISLVNVDGQAFSSGDCDYQFTIMSISKPFVFALVSEAIGVYEVRDRVGVNATGLPFNSLEAIERSPQGRTNPMVNSGAIATTSLVPGD